MTGAPTPFLQVDLSGVLSSTLGRTAGLPQAMAGTVSEVFSHTPNHAAPAAVLGSKQKLMLDTVALEMAVRMSKTVDTYHNRCAWLGLASFSCDQPRVQPCSITCESENVCVDRVGAHNDRQWCCLLPTTRRQGHP